MDFLRKYLDKIKPNFEEGGKFSKLRSTFDAFETFLFVPNKVTNRGAHVRDSIDLKRTMSIVVISLIPALLFGIWNVGFQHFRAIGETVGFWEMSWFGFLKVFRVIFHSVSFPED